MRGINFGKPKSARNQNRPSLLEQLFKITIQFAIYIALFRQNYSQQQQLLYEYNSNNNVIIKNSRIVRDVWIAVYRSAYPFAQRHLTTSADQLYAYAINNVLREKRKKQQPLLRLTCTWHLSSLPFPLAHKRRSLYIYLYVRHHKCIYSFIYVYICIYL